MIFFLPGNDFTDNDYDAYKSFGRDRAATGRSRYRPYWRSVENGFETFFPEDAVPTENFGHLNEGMIGKIKRFLIRYSYTSNPIRSAFALRDILVKSHSLNYSGYYDSTELQQKAATFYIENLYKITNEKNKKFVIILIPGIEDI